jgi:hypothetical protein
MGIEINPLLKVGILNDLEGCGISATTKPEDNHKCYEESNQQPLPGLFSDAVPYLRPLFLFYSSLGQKPLHPHAHRITVQDQDGVPLPRREIHLCDLPDVENLRLTEDPSASLCSLGTALTKDCQLSQIVRAHKVNGVRVGHLLSPVLSASRRGKDSMSVTYLDWR